MANSRLITSDIWLDDWFGELGFFEQALWIGLFSKCADDQGRLLDNPVLIRAAVFPYKDVSLEDIEQGLDQFATAKRTYRYVTDGKKLTQVLHWWEHQRPQWAMASKYAPPAGWQDHVRTNYKGEYVTLNWLKQGGNARANADWQPNLSPVQPPIPPSYPPDLAGHIIDPNPDPIIEIDPEPAIEVSKLEPSTLDFSTAQASSDSDSDNSNASEPESDVELLHSDALEQGISSLSASLRDNGAVASNVTRAYNIWCRTGLDEPAILACMKHATMQLEKRPRDPPLKKPMAWWFKVFTEEAQACERERTRA